MVGGNVINFTNSSKICIGKSLQMGLGTPFLYNGANHV